MTELRWKYMKTDFMPVRQMILSSVYKGSSEANRRCKRIVF